jgi:Mg2+ and Co2+ transporter CorA
MSENLNLESVDDPDDQRIDEAADEVVSGLEKLVETLGNEVALALFDAIADKLDTLIEQTGDALEAEAEDEDEALIDDDEVDDQDLALIRPD